MGAFTYARFNQIEANVKALAERCLYHYSTTFDATHTDMLEMFVKPEHHKMVTEITEIADISYSNALIQFPVTDEDTGISVNVILQLLAVGTKKPFIVPRYAMGGPLYSDTEMMTKLRRWVRLRVQLAEDFGHMFALLNWCQTHCSTPAVVRYIWPAVVPLIGLDETGRDMADQLRTFRLPSTLPRIPRGLQQYAKESEQRIVRALLMPEPTNEAINEAIGEVSINSGSVQGRNTPWGERSVRY